MQYKSESIRNHDGRRSSRSTRRDELTGVSSGNAQLLLTSKSCDVATARTNLRSRSVTVYSYHELRIDYRQSAVYAPRANIVCRKNSSRSARGLDGVISVYAFECERSNLVMYSDTLSL